MCIKGGPQLHGGHKGSAMSAHSKVKDPKGGLPGLHPMGPKASGLACKASRFCLFLGTSLCNPKGTLQKVYPNSCLLKCPNVSTYVSGQTGISEQIHLQQRNLFFHSLSPRPHPQRPAGRPCRRQADFGCRGFPTSKDTLSASYRYILSFSTQTAVSCLCKTSKVSNPSEVSKTSSLSLSTPRPKAHAWYLLVALMKERLFGVVCSTKLDRV